MRYNGYVDTAARFVEDLDQRLAAGQSLGALASGARKALAADPHRQIGRRHNAASSVAMNSAATLTEPGTQRPGSAIPIVRGPSGGTLFSSPSV
jgi:hypothetical protein